jgi:hypothetical protein
MRSTAIWVMGGISAVMFVGGAAAMYVEGGSYLTGPLTQSRAILAMDSIPLPLSAEAQREPLTTCFELLTAIPTFDYLDLTEAEQARLPGICLAKADAIVAGTPSYSLAWYVGALSAALMGDWDGMNERLVRSQQTGQYEQWIGELRVALSEDYLPHLSAEASAGHDQDLEMLVQSGRGVQSIAARYVRDEAFRERITAIVETMSPLDQRRFLGNLRARASR